ncbi:DP-EP family protein [Shewanella donghaensis]|uniref:DP-EP family protein n=1 Tax=Shewanella donghaensis TaxID=238836 RepID=UPI0011833B37|nr:DP-EP family protein [Shewanella donghaensis]
MKTPFFRFTKLSCALLISASALAQAATQQQIDVAFAPINSAESLQMILSQPSALDALGDDLPAFIHSIQFGQNANSAVQFDNSALETNLTVSEVYNILSLFGLQSSFNQYTEALVISDTDKLLQQNFALPFCDNASPIDLHVTMNKKKQVKFKYKQTGVVCDGNVELFENTTITYRLKHNKRTPKGLRIEGAGFTNPYDAHIERVSISRDGQSISLDNNIENKGVSKFQFIFNSEETDLLLVSPDPQVINRGDT